MKQEIETTEGRFAYEGVDREIHEKARLGIMTSLINHPQGLMFNELKEFCLLTDGNLNRHLKVLLECEAVEIWKASQKKRSQTLCRITQQGKDRFIKYLSELEKVIEDSSRVGS